MNLVNKIKEDMKQAMKNKEVEKLSTLRLLIAELEKEKVQLKLVDVNKLSDNQTQSVISRQIKKLQKEIESYVMVGRSVDKQEAEKEFLVTYLPKQLTKDEIRAEIRHAMSLVERGEIKNPMQYLGQKLKGRADMKLVVDVAKEIQKESK